MATSGFVFDEAGIPIPAGLLDWEDRAAAWYDDHSATSGRATISEINLGTAVFASDHYFERVVLAYATVRGETSQGAVWAAWGLDCEDWLDHRVQVSSTRTEVGHGAGCPSRMTRPSSRSCRIRLRSRGDAQEAGVLDKLGGVLR